MPMYGNSNRDFQSEQDASTLHDAHVIRSDSKRHASAMKHMKKKAKGSDSIALAHAHEQRAKEIAVNHTGAITNAAGEIGATQDTGAA